MSLLEPIFRRPFLKIEFPISDEVLHNEQHRRIPQKEMHCSDDTSLSTKSSQMNKSIAGGCSTEDKSRKYVAHRVAE